jgi:hypothetical protein
MIDKRTMLQRAFEHVGFTHVNVSKYSVGYHVDFDNAPPCEWCVIADMGLHLRSGGAEAHYVTVRWRVAFERWYAAHVEQTP